MTLSQTYISRKQLLVDNLVAQGVTGYTVNDGLTTLINAVLEIGPTPGFDGIDLSSDKDILSAYDSESATLTAQLLSGSSPALVAGETVSFEVRKTSDDSLVETLTGTTNASGIATVSYLGKGTGDLYIKVFSSDRIISSVTYEVQDCSYYDTQTVDKSRYTVTSGGATISYSSDGVTITGTQQRDCYVKNTALILPTSYSLEVTLTQLGGDTSSGITYYGGLCFDNCLIDMASNKIDIYTLSSLSLLTSISQSFSGGDVLKIEMNNGTMSIYKNNSLLTTQSISSTGIYQHRSYKNGSKAGRTITAKDLTVKPL